VSIRHLPILVSLRASMDDTGDSEVGPRQPLRSHLDSRLIQRANNG